VVAGFGLPKTLSAALRATNVAEIHLGRTLLPRSARACITKRSKGSPGVIGHANINPVQGGEIGMAFGYIQASSGPGFGPTQRLGLWTARLI
jgi:hypothetical protein